MSRRTPLPGSFPDPPQRAPGSGFDLGYASDPEENDIQAWGRRGSNGPVRHGTVTMPRSLRRPTRPLPFVTHDQKMEMAYLTRFFVQFDIRHVGMPLGFSAFTAMWRALSVNFDSFDVPRGIWFGLWHFTALLAALVFGIYAFRAVRYPHLLYRDFTNSTLTNFFASPGIVIGGLILSVPPYLQSDTVTEVFFFILTAYQITLSLYWYGDWLFATGHSLRRISALYFMATINFFIIASVGVSVGHVELASYLFLIGLLFWLLVFISAFSFLSNSFAEGTETPSPTLFLFIAPPAAAASTWLAISRARGDPLLSDMFRFLTAVVCFMYLLLLRLFGVFYRLKFSVAFWAYIFPLGSAATLAILTTQLYPTSSVADAVAIIAVVVCTVLVLVVSALTGRAIAMGQIPSSDLALRVHTQFLQAQVASSETSGPSGSDEALAQDLSGRLRGKSTSTPAAHAEQEESLPI